MTQHPSSWTSTLVLLSSQRASALRYALGNVKGKPGSCQKGATHVRERLWQPARGLTQDKRHALDCPTQTAIHWFQSIGPTARWREIIGPACWLQVIGIPADLCFLARPRLSAITFYPWWRHRQVIQAARTVVVTLGLELTILATCTGSEVARHMSSLRSTEPVLRGWRRLRDCRWAVPFATVPLELHARSESVLYFSMRRAASGKGFVGGNEDNAKAQEQRRQGCF